MDESTVKTDTTAKAESTTVKPTAKVEDKPVVKVEEKPAVKAEKKVEAKPDTMQAIVEYLGPYERKIKNNNIRVLVFVGPGTPTEEQIEMPIVAGAIKEYFTKA